MDKLDELEGLYDQMTVLALQKQDLIDRVIPSEIKQALADIEAEFQEQESTLRAKIAALEECIKGDVLLLGQTVKNDRYMVVYNPGGKQVSVKDLLDLANQYERINPSVAGDLRSIITLKRPSTSIQVRKG